MRRILAGTLLLGLAVGLAATVAAGPSEEEKIDAVIAAVVDAYLTADTAAMARYYAPNVSFVPGDYNPPLQGWASVEQQYRQGFAQLSGMVLGRENTHIERRGKFAWAVYQWRFAGTVGNQGLEARGHTTLVLEKQGGNWVIVHNHTSVLPVPPPPATPANQPAPPGR